MEETDLLVRLEQRSDGPLHVTRGPTFQYRYAYARSADSGRADEPGQDYLVYRDMGRSFVFAVCDGVGSSFFGDLGARLLGDELVRWLKTNEANLSDARTFKTALTYYLSSGLPASATRVVDAHPFEVDVDMLREHLEGLRGRGSEAMFVCGRLDQPGPDLPQGRVAIAWLGDMRLFLWRAQGPVDLGGGLDTDRRWSTKQGVIGGTPTAYVGPLTNPDNPVTRLVTYSDGFDVFDDQLDAELSDARLQALIDSTRQQSGSDDVSFLEVWTRPPAQPALVAQEQLPRPRQLPLTPPAPTTPLPPKLTPPSTVRVVPAGHTKLNPRAAPRWTTLLLVGLLSLLVGMFAGRALFGGDAVGEPPVITPSAFGLTPTRQGGVGAVSLATPTRALPTATRPLPMLPTVTTQPPTATATQSPTATHTPTVTPSPTATPALTSLTLAADATPQWDNDDDGLPDESDLCPSVNGAAFLEQGGRGCDRADFDADGLNDDADLCPTEWGGAFIALGGLGCRTVDLDRDEAVDEQDECPREHAGPTPDPALPGCPLRPSDTVPAAGYP